MLIGALLLGAGSFMMLQKAEAQTKFALSLLNQRRTIAKTGMNTPPEDDETANPSDSTYEEPIPEAEDISV